MNNQSALARRQTEEGKWPFDTSAYDRRPELTEVEAEAISSAMRMVGSGNSRWPLKYRSTLARLLDPIDDIFKYIGLRDLNTRNAVRRLLMIGMNEHGSSYWKWGISDWMDVLDAEMHRWVRGHCRLHLIAFSYVIGFTDLHLLPTVQFTILAERVFGEQPVRIAIETIQAAMGRVGYSNALKKQIVNTLCRVLLIIRSPRIEDITVEALVLERDSFPFRYAKSNCIPISRALQSLGIVSEALSPRIVEHKRKIDITEGVAPDWCDFADRWRKTSTLEPMTRKGVYLAVIKAGRWLSTSHPEVTSLEDWTYEITLEFRAALINSKVGDWVIGKENGVYGRGKPLSPNAFCNTLSYLRIFFRDCQEWDWISRRFSPGRAFSIPKNVKPKLAQEPRVIASDVWAKLLNAGLNLKQEDLPKMGKPGVGEYFYPIEMVRAVTIVWLFAGLRANEILRLRVGCVRWQREELAVAGTGERLSKDSVCWLDVPVSKSGKAFTKPVDTIVGKAITAWERVRPAQPSAIDRKAGEIVHFLFSHRSQLLGKVFLNRSIIPLLCNKAGVPREDAKGFITSHRARSTIASQLFNSDDPLSLFELQEWLGHGSPYSTQRYAKIYPTKLAKKYSKAGYFERNIRTVEVLIDRDAVVSGAAARGEPWRYYDLGHGLCTNEFFVECPHRMACAKCAFYVPKESMLPLNREGRANLLKMRQKIPLTEDEVEAVDEGVEAFERLCAKLTDVPTPAGQTPRQLKDVIKDVIASEPEEEEENS